MIKAAPSQNGGVDHFQPVGHANHKHLTLVRFRYAPQKFGNFLHMVQASGSVSLTVGQVGLHLVDDDQGWGRIHCLIKHLTNLLAGLMNVGTGNTAGIDRENWPIQMLAQPFHGKRLATAWWPMEDNGGRKVNPKRSVPFRVFNNVNNALVEEGLKSRTSRQAKGLLWED